MSWQQRAACGRLDAAEADRLFFSNSTLALAEGRDLCRTCPVRTECQALADEFEHGWSRDRVHGVFGGEFATERIRRRAPFKATA